MDFHCFCVEKSGKYVLFGLPFFNESDNEMKNRFDESFIDTLGIDKKTFELQGKEEVPKVAEKK